jgi:ketosteroid isomerase-like protein
MVQQSSEGTRVLQPQPLKARPMLARIEPDHKSTEAWPPREDPLALIETFRAAYERQDIGTLMKLFTSVPRERDAIGRAAVAARYAQNFAALDRIHYELARLETSSPAANGPLVVQGWFRIRAVRRDDPSDLVNAVGAIRWVLRREADALRIAEVHYVLSRP